MKLTELFSLFLALAVILSVAVLPVYATTPEEDAAYSTGISVAGVIIIIGAVLAGGALLVIMGAVVIVVVISVKEKKAKAVNYKEEPASVQEGCSEENK